MRRKHTEKKTWPPDWLPDVLLPPDKEPEISMEELFNCTSRDNDSDNDLDILYYRRSGRIIDSSPELHEDAEEVDLYCYVRSLLGGKLPWENAEGDSIEKPNKPVIVFLDQDNTHWVKIRAGEMRRLTNEEWSDLVKQGHSAFSVVQRTPRHLRAQGKDIGP